MNEDKKFRLERHEYRKNEIINSAPSEVKEIYNKLVTQLNELDVNSPRKRANFLTFWLGVEFQSLFSKVLTGELREGKYYQVVCNAIENLLKYSFNDILPITWILSSVMKEMAEESMRFNRQLNNHK